MARTQCICDMFVNYGLGKPEWSSVKGIYWKDNGVENRLNNGNTCILCPKHLDKLLFTFVV